MDSTATKVALTLGTAVRPQRSDLQSFDLSEHRGMGRGVDYCASGIGMIDNRMPCRISKMTFPPFDMLKSGKPDKSSMIKMPKRSLALEIGYAE